MINAVKRASCLVVPLLAAAASCLAQDAPTTTASLYRLPAGTQLVFKTTADIQVKGKKAESHSAEIATSYTVLQESASGITLFTASNLLNMKTDGKEEQGDKPEARFTFEMGADGQMGEKVAGLYQPVFSEWHPKSDFPEIPDEAVSTITLSLPFVGQPVPALAKRSVKDDEITIEAKYTPDDTMEGSGVKIEDFSTRYVYSTKDNALVSYLSEFKATQSDPTAGDAAISFKYESKRTKLTKLDPTQFEALKKDVAAGIAVFDQLREALSGGQESAKKVKEIISGYLKDYPKGEFASAYGQILEQAQMSSAFDENFAKLEKGKPAPAFEAKTITGETLKLADLKGKVVLLDFWATWCAPCVAELPTVKKLYDENKDKGFVVVGISADRDEDALKEFVKQREVGWPQIFQSGGMKKDTVLFQYGVQKYPTTVLIDREGNISAIDVRDEELVKLVTELVGKK